MSIRTAVEKSLLLCAGIVVGAILSVAVRAHADAHVNAVQQPPPYASGDGEVHLLEGQNIFVDCKNSKADGKKPILTMRQADNRTGVGKCTSQ
jgi:hypothetical protein